MSITRRCINCAAFTAVWMACAWLLGLRPVAYLILGVPLVAAFQLALNRRPIQQLWVRDAATFRLVRTDFILAVVLMVVPAYFLIEALSLHNWDRALLVVAGVAGAPCAAFALRHQRADKLTRALPSAAAAVAIGCAIMVGMALLYDRSPLFAPSRLLYLLGQFALMFPLCFLLEEVAFRGALDTHAVPSPGDRQQGWVLAVIISAIWGLWHLPLHPIASLSDFFRFAGLDLGVHIAIGVPLSFCWRTSGTLVLPCAAHALIDAYRNTIFN